MLLRRTAYSIINSMAAAFFVVFFALVIGLLFDILEVETTRSSGATVIFWIFLTLLGLFDSALLRNGFIGAWISGISVSSDNTRTLSFFGTFVHASIFWLIPAQLVPSLFPDFSSGATLDRPLWIACATIALLIPSSLVVTRGHCGLHDIILGIKIDKRRQSAEPYRQPSTLRIVFLSMLLSFCISVVINEVAQSIGWLKRPKWEVEELRDVLEDRMKESNSRSALLSTVTDSSLHTFLKNRGFATTVGFLSLSNLNYRTHDNSSVVVVLDTFGVFMSPERREYLASLARSELVRLGAISNVPSHVQILRKVSFGGIELEFENMFLISDSKTEQVSRSVRFMPMIAICCGKTELGLTGD